MRCYEKVGSSQICNELPISKKFSPSILFEVSRMKQCGISVINEGSYAHVVDVFIVRLGFKIMELNLPSARIGWPCDRLIIPLFEANILTDQVLILFILPGH